MAEAGDEWELSKENVQPLRQGRAMSTLQEVLSQQDSATHNAVQQKKQAFELELRFYTGDDPLDVWDRYIRWAEQAFPQGGKESILSPLLERAVKIFHEDQKYYGDLRYLNICLKFAHFCTEPIDLYSYLHSQGIGILHAQLYITWAEEYEARGNYKKADAIFQEGIQRKAEPLDKTETHHKEFQARVSRQVLQGIGEGADAQDFDVAEPERSSLVDLKAKGKNKVRAPVNRVGGAVKPRSQGLSAPSAPAQQIPSRARVAVFDENLGAPVLEGMPSTTVQPWAALPPARAKENEQKAGPWNSGKPSRSSHQYLTSEPIQSLPSFTPYVDELAEQQTVTPCKINPAVSTVLSSRKPGKEEDPLQRLQSNSQGKEEVVMYCKSKIYAGVEEFSLEEIRAEIYTAKMRKRSEEELQASALRRQEMERQIEEMEKRLKESHVTSQETVADQSLQPEVSFKIYCDDEEKSAQQEAVSTARSRECPGLESASMERNATAPSLTSTEIPLVDENQLGRVESSPAQQSSSVPFAIFEETCEPEPDISSRNSMPPPKRRPLAPISRPPAKHAPLTDTLDDIEPLSEDAIVTGSDRNKTLFAEPEDTCDFMRAAQLASTPFQKTKDELKGSEVADLGSVPPSEKTPVCEESFQQVVGPKKLSPILEASQEDTRSSVSSASSVSAASTSLSTSKTLIIQEKFDLVSGVYEQALEEGSLFLPSTELQRNLLEAMPDILALEAIHQEAGQIPTMKEHEKVLLGGESYNLRGEILSGVNSRIFMATQADCDLLKNVEGVALKVDLKPLPWHLYVVQQLKERLGEAIKNSCFEQSACYAFQDGNVTLYKEVYLLSILDLLQDTGTVVEKVVVMLVYNLLDLVEKLHSAEMVHGDLRPEILLLDVELSSIDSYMDMNNCFKLIDFSHSMDIQLCQTLTARAFPIAHTEFGQQVLSPQASPYQVDLLGIANVVHWMIFKKSLQIQQHDSSWKITEEMPRFWNGSLWDAFFSKILNSSCGSTVDLLKELKDKMAELFDECFEEEVCSYLIKVELQHQNGT